MSAPMPDDRSFHVLEAIPSRLEVSPERPRRRWSAQAKIALIEETLKPGANVSAIARQAGIAPAQLFGWRRKAMQAGVVQGAEERIARLMAIVKMLERARYGARSERLG